MNTKKSRKKYVVAVLDTETTGLPKRKHANPEETYLFPYVVQLSWLIFNSGTNKVEALKDKIIRLPKRSSRAGTL